MVISNARIVENIEIAHNIWRMVFESPELAQDYKGVGQFVSILINDNWEHPIRRPMSIADVSKDKITIIYKIFGSVTKSLKKFGVGDTINVLGLFGNTFKTTNKKYTPVLIGGGVGLAPILNLSNYFSKNGINAYKIIGAKSKDEHFLKHNPKEKYYLSTDDGSFGIKGTVIDAIISIHNLKYPYIYACGPEPMLAALKKYMSKNVIPGQFSVESYMACGFGFCQGCAIQTTDNNYSLVCKDGPVYDYNEVSFG